jgi:hypothetical protein
LIDRDIEVPCYDKTMNGACNFRSRIKSNQTESGAATLDMEIQQTTGLGASRESGLGRRFMEE